MNKLIFRKLSYDILVFFLLSSISITTIIWVIQGVNLLDIVSEQGHALRVYFIYSALNIPKIFSKLIVFTFFISLFVVISRYEENNEILVFWVNGIKKISFINFIAKISVFFLLFQLTLTLIIVPYTQNHAQLFLKNSSIDYFPKLIQEKEFSNIGNNLTIFVEEYDEKRNLKGIYIREKINKNETKIIIANKGRLIDKEGGFGLVLFDGTITNIDKKTSFNLNFQETNYAISNLNSKTRKESKLDEIESNFLIKCLNNFFEKRKDDKLRCGEENSFLLKDIYEEIFKRLINPIYIIILALISSLVIVKSRVNKLQNYYKFFLFITGFFIIIFSELSYKLIFYSNQVEILSLMFPILFIFLFYFFILIKSNFNFKYL